MSNKQEEVLVHMETTNAENSSLIKVELLCADCKTGKHGCARAWQGLGLDIHCCCSCVYLGTNVTAEGSEPVGRADNNEKRKQTTLDQFFCVEKEEVTA
jgi:hypothetical protein